MQSARCSRNDMSSRDLQATGKIAKTMWTIKINTAIIEESDEFFARHTFEIGPSGISVAVAPSRDESPQVRICRVAAGTTGERDGGAAAKRGGGSAAGAGGLLCHLSLLLFGGTGDPGW